jgi:DNA mismatch repair protein MutS
MIKSGFNAELDRLRYVSENGKQLITELESREREKTGIKNLKIGYNRVFGYYIEVSRAYTGELPENYIRKQTISNCERYITAELKELDTTILEADDKICTLEYELFCSIRDEVKAQSSRIMQTAAAVARLDTLASLAEVAVSRGYTRPEIDMSGEIIIKDGRHPVVEAMRLGEIFVPNDTQLDKNGNRLAIITGPNMAGKSTYMRQVALIVILAQIGSFVPASSAKIGLVDKIFTRIGAGDELAAGKSTFMVEMSETASILASATPDSLIIFDEIGRGTSTFDGMSIARAVLEYVASKKIGAKTMFATHYHELTMLENEIEGVKNYNITAKKRGDEIIFLRKIVRGGADDSYGIEVGMLAGLPKQVISKAKEYLEQLESGENRRTVAAAAKTGGISEQEDLLEDRKRELLAYLSSLSVEAMTPLEALNVLYKLSKQATELI